MDSHGVTPVSSSIDAPNQSATTTTEAPTHPATHPPSRRQPMASDLRGEHVPVGAGIQRNNVTAISARSVTESSTQPGNFNALLRFWQTMSAHQKATPSILVARATSPSQVATPISPGTPPAQATASHGSPPTAADISNASTAPLALIMPATASNGGAHIVTIATASDGHDGLPSQHTELVATAASTSPVAPPSSVTGTIIVAANTHTHTPAETSTGNTGITGTPTHPQTASATISTTPLFPTGTAPGDLLASSSPTAPSDRFTALAAAGHSCISTFFGRQGIGTCTSSATSTPIPPWFFLSLGHGIQQPVRSSIIRNGHPQLSAASA